MRDGGIDLRMSREGRTYIVECKCYDRSHRAGRPVAQKLQGANAVERAGRMVVVTTSTFSPRTRSTRGPGGRRAHRRRLITMCRRAWGDTLPQQTILDPNADLLDSYPAVSRTWGDTLHISPAGSGFNVAYMTDGDLPSAHPYNPRDPARRATPAQRPVTTIDSALELWRKEPQRLIAREHTGAIKIHYSWSEFKNIPSQDFAAYWAGKIQIRRAGYYRFRMTQSWSQVRILLNRHRIYEGGKDLTPRVWLEPGSYTLEVEYLNNWHTTDFELALETAPAKESER